MPTIVYKNHFFFSKFMNMAKVNPINLELLSQDIRNNIKRTSELLNKEVTISYSVSK